MLEGFYAENALQHKNIRPYPIAPQETSGLDSASSIHRYALHESDYPVLSVVDELVNEYGDKIPAGHYELALSDDREFLIMIQSRTPVAIIPVFKIEEDVSQPTKKEKKIKKKQEKERAKVNAKRAKTGLPPDIEPIHMDASLEYIKEGKYYLIRYEKGKIRAWGAIKG